MPRSLHRYPHSRLSAPTRRSPLGLTLGQLRWLFGLLAAIVVWGSQVACNSTDTGKCCSVAPGKDPNLIPKPEITDGGQIRDNIVRDRAFTCETFTCASYQGAKAYCTEQCLNSSSCPQGYDCLQVIQAMAGPDAGILNAKYCVKAGLACTP